jgi:hypothetical protein
MARSAREDGVAFTGTVIVQSIRDLGQALPPAGTIEAKIVVVLGGTTQSFGVRLGGSDAAA